jgi:hypothetical protein
VEKGAACAIAAAGVSSTTRIAHGNFGLDVSLGWRMRRAGGKGAVVGWSSRRFDRL